MTTNRFEKTGGYRIGSVMLGRDWSPEFAGDFTIYNALYGRGFRAFQLFLIGHSDEYLRVMHGNGLTISPMETLSLVDSWRSSSLASKVPVRSAQPARKGRLRTIN